MKILYDILSISIKIGLFVYIIHFISYTRANNKRINHIINNQNEILIKLNSLINDKGQGL